MRMLFISFILLFSGPTFSSANEWVLLEKEDKVQLFTGTKSINGIFPYKAKVWVAFTIPEILAVFLDAKRKVEWIPRVKSTWVEKIPNSPPGSRVEYGEVLIPWPFENRDVLVRVDTVIDESVNKVKLHVSSIQNERVIKKGNVRAIVYPSNLTMTWDPKTKETLLEAVSFTDPRGNIPTWVVNLFQKTEALNLVQLLIKQLKKNIYSQENLNEIRSELNIIRNNFKLKKAN